VKTPPDDLDDSTIVRCLHVAHRFDIESLAHSAVGFGSHHWLATGRGGEMLFVTLDDLHAKRRDADDTTDAVFLRLAAAFAAVHDLQNDAQLEFVVGPIAAPDGTTLQRLTDRYSLVVHPVLTGTSAGEDGRYDSADGPRAVLALLVELHGATAVAALYARTDDFVVPCRDALGRALAELERPWRTGPYAEPARELLAAHADGVLRLVDHYDHLVEAVAPTLARGVITHGEPHASNVMLTASGPRLVDWDTALVAPPERDLWMLAGEDDSVLPAYTAATGVEIDDRALDLYRLWFDLAEIGGYVALFRETHAETADTAESWLNLVEFLQPSQRWPSVAG
jgi:spectinomycin phosphotransferase